MIFNGCTCCVDGAVPAGESGARRLSRQHEHESLFADETCIHCGKCASICPSGAIGMVEGRPAWEKKKCLKCCGCINRCPVSAIQYGKRTASLGRYVNTVLK